MILFASERDEAGSARSAPVDTYTEILGLTNAAYVAQHWDWTCCYRPDSAPQIGWHHLSLPQTIHQKRSACSPVALSRWTRSP
jgi:hypothetical protein